MGVIGEEAVRTHDELTGRGEKAGLLKKCGVAERAPLRSRLGLMGEGNRKSNKVPGEWLAVGEADEDGVICPFELGDGLMRLVRRKMLGGV